MYTVQTRNTNLSLSFSKELEEKEDCLREFIDNISLHTHNILDIILCTKIKKSLYFSTGFRG